MVNELHWGKGTIIHLIQPSGGMKYYLRSILSSLSSFPWWNIVEEYLTESDLLTILESRNANTLENDDTTTLLCNNDNENEDEMNNTSTSMCFSDLMPKDLVRT